jgi:CRISPR-associated protein Cmr1
MNTATSPKTYQFEALTDVWTGSVTKENGQLVDKPVPDRLITTGLLGSIRWWFEVLVRGLGGSACDPSATKCEGPKHCVVCGLFGCTGWARKFRFEVLDETSETQIKQIKQDSIFSLRFTPLRPVCDEEWALLDATLRLIAEYGAIGGKTVYKPSKENRRAEVQHHKDYGLLLNSSPELNSNKSVDMLKKYLQQENWSKQNHDKFAWASLKHFWCVNGEYLYRQDINNSIYNKVIGRLEPKGQSSQNDSWIAGYRPDQKNRVEAQSKKVFSFKNPARTFGFVNPEYIVFDAMKQRLGKVWRDTVWEFLTGDTIIERLFTKKEDRP